MKLKAIFSERGLRVLEKGFLPTLEKFGKQCEFLFGPDDVHLLQTTLSTDGLQITARLALDVLFEAGSYKCVSKNQDLIALGVDIPLMLKVLRSAAAHHADCMEMKLSMRRIPTAGPHKTWTQQPFLPGNSHTLRRLSNPSCLETRTPRGKGDGEGGGPERPTLSCSWQGHNVQVLQDLPVSRPRPIHEVDALLRQRDVSQLCPFYLDIQPEEGRLQAVVERLKGVAQELTLVTTKQGDLHLQVAAPGLHFGTEVRGLQVLPAAVGEEVLPLRAATAEERLEEADRRGEAAAACVLVKHLVKALQSSQLTAPARLLCGIAGGGDHLHFMFVYKDPLADTGYDDNISLSFKVPLRDD